jgi:hypothetical protein
LTGVQLVPAPRYHAGGPIPIPGDVGCTDVSATHVKRDVECSRGAEATAGVHGPVPERLKCWVRESGNAPSGSQAKSSGAPKQAARQPDEAMSSGASGCSQARRCQGSRGGARAGKRARTGGARTSPGARSTDIHPTGKKRLRFLQGGSEILLQEH